ncbi:hypothetical protein LCGC14_1239000 [marine sediment metagenome]|uniref:Uncharacterized protein n=1 Tax=marine sediment metagenome TaxID=412755 RepID=A0A0F9LTJ4_9ZZZZ
MTLPIPIEKMSEIIEFECGMCGLTIESLPRNIKKSKGAILKWT